MKTITRNLIILPILAAAPILFAVSPAITAPEEGDGLTVIPAGFDTLSELRINTGRKAVLADSSYNTVYVVKTPRAGDTFAHFDLQIAASDSVHLGRDDLKLLDGSGKEPVTYHPFDWFQDNGLAPDHRGMVALPEKAELEFTIEAPKDRLDALVLFIGPHRVGTVSEVRSALNASDATSPATPSGP